jgi:CheY-like chemotaxis protein
MSSDVLGHVFEPFFTTKESGRGTGLGLASAYGLLKQSGGYITAESTPDVGTVVTTYWPVVDGAVNDAELMPPSELDPSGTETILLVEDQAEVRAVMRRLLEQHGYTVIEAEDANRAIAIEASYDEPIDLLVTDIIMPGLDGVELAAQIVQRRPEMGVLLVTGYAAREAVDRGLNDLHAGFMRKPFVPTCFAQEVRACLDRTCR